MGAIKSRSAQLPPLLLMMRPARVGRIAQQMRSASCLKMRACAAQHQCSGKSGPGCAEADRCCKGAPSTLLTSCNQECCLQCPWRPFPRACCVSSNHLQPCLTKHPTLPSFLTLHLPCMPTCSLPPLLAIALALASQPPPIRSLPSPWVAGHGHGLPTCIPARLPLTLSSCCHRGRCLAPVLV